MNLGDDGCLCDPDGVYGSAQDPDVLPFTSISHLPCLVLLGEPGLGKTTAMEVERKAIEVELAELQLPRMRKV